MSCKSVIPSKTFSMTLAADAVTVLDTKGCECMLKCVSGQVLVFAKPDNSENGFYTLDADEKITFCGKLYLKGDGAKVCGMMYTTV